MIKKRIAQFRNKIIFLFSISSELSTLDYIWRDRPKGSGGDVTKWLDNIVELEQGQPDLKRAQSLYNTIRKEALFFTLLNPPLWQSFFYNIYAPFTKRDRFLMPMFRFRKFEFMPALSYGLTYWGTEKYFDDLLEI